MTERFLPYYYSNARNLSANKAHTLNIKDFKAENIKRGDLRSMTQKKVLIKPQEFLKNQQIQFTGKEADDRNILKLPSKDTSAYEIILQYLKNLL